MIKDSFFGVVHDGNKEVQRKLRGGYGTLVDAKSFYTTAYRG